MIDKLLDAFLDVLKLIPFLFVSFLIMEFIEHKLNNKKKLAKAKRFGPIIGSTFGLIPQCGFSVLASNLYATRVITIGTLFSIFLTTSDEMLPIMIANKCSLSIILKILLTKFLLGLSFGLLVDVIYNKNKKEEIHELCDEDHCHCEDGIFKSSLIHTLKISFFILIVQIILNFVIDKEVITRFIGNYNILGPIILSLVGLIPNCASSVIITELYLEQIIPFGSCIAGLLSGSGVGILVLFKQNKNLKENILILGILVLFASVCGIILNYI